MDILYIKAEVDEHIQYWIPAKLNYNNKQSSNQAVSINLNKWS